MDTLPKTNSQSTWNNAILPKKCIFQASIFRGDVSFSVIEPTIWPSRLGNENPILQVTSEYCMQLLNAPTAKAWWVKQESLQQAAIITT